MKLILTIFRDTYLYIYVSAKFKIALTLIIYQNRREENSVLRLFQFELIGKWTSENQRRMSTFWRALLPAGRVPFLKFFGPWIMWESTQWLEKNIVPSINKKNSEKAKIGVMGAAKFLK